VPACTQRDRQREKNHRGHAIPGKVIGRPDCHSRRPPCDLRHHKDRGKDEERHDIGEQRIDVVDQQHLGRCDDDRPRERTEQTVQPADERYRGGPDLPFTRDELFEKFSDCASLVLPEAEVKEVFDKVESLEKMADIGELVQALGAVKP